MDPGGAPLLPRAGYRPPPDGAALPQAQRSLALPRFSSDRTQHPVRESSTGYTSEPEAEAVGAAEEARIRGEFLVDGCGCQGAWHGWFLGELARRSKMT